MRINTTTIDQFRLYSQPENDWLTEDALIAAIKGEFRSTPQIELGIAFERILQDPDRYLIPGGYRCGDFTFELRAIEPALELIDRRGVFQVKTTKRYGAIDVVNKCDHITGAIIDEFKTTTSTFDAEKYLASCQWRFAIDAFGAELVRYHVFCLDDHGNGVVELRDVHSFNVFPYPELHQDCRTLVHQFAEYVTAKGLDGILRQRQADAA